MKYKIGVFGSAVEEGGKTTKIAQELGRELAKLKDAIIVNGACSGIPYEVVYEAHKNGAEIWGYSPAINLEGQKKFTPDCDLSVYKKIIFTPKDFEFSSNDQVARKYRNVISTANCDAGIIISGRWGTMNEFTNLYDMGKVVGVLTGTGGIADELPNLMKKISKKSKAVVLFDNSPEHLVKKVMKELRV